MSKLTDISMRLSQRNFLEGERKHLIQIEFKPPVTCGSPS